jgi:hypothetical protein
MICTLSTTLHRSTQKHLHWHSITKILRNGPRAHFPFSTPSSMPASSARSYSPSRPPLATPPEACFASLAGCVVGSWRCVGRRRSIRLGLVIGFAWCGAGFGGRAGIWRQTRRRLSRRWGRQEHREQRRGHEVQDRVLGEGRGSRGGRERGHDITSGGVVKPCGARPRYLLIE